MTGPLQIGDIAVIARLAWDVYNFGFTVEHNATKQYAEFGSDVRGLAQHLDTLSSIVDNVAHSLQAEASHGAVVRWDPVSLLDIVGDFRATLEECQHLLSENRRYGLATNAFRNLEWNVMVQDSAERLRRRIIMHNTKIALVLKPFEIDLLLRVRQDIYRVHQDLVYRIKDVQRDVHRIIGLLVPDLEQELAQQEDGNMVLPEVPPDIAARFLSAALGDRPEGDGDSASFGLGELSDAFVLHFETSTTLCRSNTFVPQRTPPLEQYLNLLKSIWIYDLLQKRVLAGGYPESDSHWPSFVKRLKHSLSAECSRFNGELIEPQFTLASLTETMFSIWPEREPAQLVDIHTRDEMMEKVLEVPLKSSSPNVERSVRLLRRTGSDGRKFRIVISGSERTISSKPRNQVEIIDIDLASAIITPHYAIPTSPGLQHEIIIHREERIARLSFVNLRDVLKFQQAVTGFKAWASYCEYDVLVSFVVAGRKEPVVEKACVQLWVSRPVGGALVTNQDVSKDLGHGPSRGASMATSTSGRHTSSPDPQPRYRDGSGSQFPRGSEAIPMMVNQPHRHPTTGSGHRAWYESAGSVTSSPPRGGTFPPHTSSPPRSHPQHIPQAPGSSSPFPYAPPSPRSSGPLSSSPTQILSSSPQRIGTTFSSNPSAPNIPPLHRAQSVSSHVSRTTASNSISSSSDAHTWTISTGPNTTGYLHQQPLKPRLVLFTENSRTQQVSMVSIDIDDNTTINPERCNCRRSGKSGESCVIASIEQRKGKSNLKVKRYKTSGMSADTDWNLARLASNQSFLSSASPSLASTMTDGEDTVWPNVGRISLLFPTSEARATFGGVPNMCHCVNRTEGELTDCLASGHKGLFGEVKESYRVLMNSYYQARFHSRQQVVDSQKAWETRS